MRGLKEIALEILIKYSLARRKIIEMSSTDEDFAEMELERELEEYERKIKEASD